MRHDSSSVTAIESSQKMQPRSGLGCSISVISLQKLKTFLEQPKYRPPCQSSNQVLPYPHHDSRNIEDNLPGNVDSSQIPNLFSNHESGRVNSNHSSVPPPPPMGQQGPPNKKGGLMPPMGPPPPDAMGMAPPAKMSPPPPHPNPGDMNPSANGNSGRKYQCKMCPQIFGSKADLQLHTQIHMRDAKPYKCSQCSKTFANSSYLSQHTRIHLGIKPYRCEICHRKFTQLSHLQQHIRTHTGDKPYKCRYPNCNKAFSQLSNLQSHSRCHQTDKPFKCNSCYKCFSDEASLLEHIPKHKESKHLKTHICQFCGKSYTQETYLAKHMQKHADRLDKHGMMNSLVIGASMTSAVPQLQPDMLWQKAIHAKVAENVSLCEDMTHSSVAAMAAVVASSQRRNLDTSLPPHLVDHSRLGLSREMDARHDTRLSLCNDQNDLGGPPPTSHGLYDSQPPMSVANSNNTGNKSTSAFTPIQSGLLPITGGNQLNISGSSRTYFPYESINFAKSSHAPTSVEVKPLHSSFPNQLISLRQIRSYASMPGISGVDHPISLKSKAPN